MSRAHPLAPRSPSSLRPGSNRLFQLPLFVLALAGTWRPVVQIRGLETAICSHSEEEGASTLRALGRDLSRPGPIPSRPGQPFPHIRINSPFSVAMICTGAHRNPATCGANQGTKNLRFAPTLKKSVRQLCSGTRRFLSRANPPTSRSAGCRVQGAGCRVQGAGCRV